MIILSICSITLIHHWSTRKRDSLSPRPNATVVPPRHILPELSSTWGKSFPEKSSETTAISSLNTTKSKNFSNEIIVYAGDVIDGIQVGKKLYGSNTGSVIKIDLSENEILNAVQYGRHTHRPDIQDF